MDDGIGYSYDELVRRLCEHGCKVELQSFSVGRDTRQFETRAVKYRDRETPLQIGDDEEVARDVVESLISRLGLPSGPFDL